MYTMCLCTVIYYVAVYMLLTNRHMIVKELHTHIYIYIQIHVYMFIYMCIILYIQNIMNQFTCLQVQTRCKSTRSSVWKLVLPPWLLHFLAEVRLYTCAGGELCMCIVQIHV